MRRRLHRSWQLGVAVLAVTPAVGFARPAPPVPLTVTLTGGGSVTSTDGRIRCGLDCTARYRRHPVVTLRATAAPPDFAFARWSGGCVGLVPQCAVAVDRATSVRAVFTRISVPIEVMGSGPGAVESDPPGIDCRPQLSRCSGSFGRGTTVRLTAVPAADGRFAGWSVPGCAGETCERTVVDPLSVRAAFGTAAPAAGDQLVTVTAESTTVRSDPPGVDCSGSCQAAFPAGTLVTFGAPGAVWSGACWGVGPSCAVVADRPVQITAKFFPPTPTGSMFGLNVTVSGPGRVTGGLPGRSLLCGRGVGSLLGCEQLFPYRSQVQLRAQPVGRHARFGGWGGFCVGHRKRCEVTVTAAKTVMAVFRR